MVRSILDLRTDNNKYKHKCLKWVQIMHNKGIKTHTRLRLRQLKWIFFQ